MTVAVFFNAVELKLKRVYEGGKEVRNIVLGYVSKTSNFSGYLQYAI